MLEGGGKAPLAPLNPLTPSASHILQGLHLHIAAHILNKN